MIIPAALHDVEHILLEVAPTVAHAFGGPLAGVIASALSGLFGESSLDGVAVKINGDPDGAKSALLQLENSLKNAMGIRSPSGIKVTIEINFPDSPS